jgi:hypothetical protein
MTTAQQFEFNLSVSPEKPSVAGLRELLHVLKSLGPVWTTAGQLAERLGLSDRTVRKLAEASEGQIVSAPGCPGYKHFDHCTAEEIARASDKLRSQARLMLKRSIRLRAKAHKIIR